MPLAPNQKAFALQRAGYDPAKFDVDENGVVTPINTSSIQPSMSNGLPQPKLALVPTTNAFETGARETLHAAPAATMGGLGAWGGAEIGGGIGAFPLLSVPTGGLSIPIGAGLGAITGGLLAGGATAAAQGALEEKFAPEYTAARAARNAEHPLAAMAGRLAALPLGGMNPSGANVLRAGGDAAKIAAIMARGGKLSGVRPNELANIANVGIGTALGTGIPLGQQLAQGKGLGESLMSPETVEGAAGGMLFNKPNRIGNMLGFHSPEEPTRVLNRTENTAQISSMNKLIGDYMRNQQLQQVIEQQRGIKAAPTELNPLNLLNNISSTMRPAVKETAEAVKFEGKKMPLLSAKEAKKQSVVTREEAYLDDPIIQGRLAELQKAGAGEPQAPKPSVKTPLRKEVEALLAKNKDTVYLGPQALENIRVHSAGKGVTQTINPELDTFGVAHIPDIKQD